MRSRTPVAAVAYAVLTWQSFSDARNTEYGWISSPMQAMTVFVFVFYNCGYYLARWAGLGDAGQEYLGELRKFRIASNAGLIELPGRRLSHSPAGAQISMFASACFLPTGGYGPAQGQMMYTTKWSCQDVTMRGKRQRTTGG
jgi:hypothetical protein